MFSHVIRKIYNFDGLFNKKLMVTHNVTHIYSTRTSHMEEKQVGKEVTRKTVGLYIFIREYIMK